MGIVSWLHLSDWHHRCPISGDRKKKRKRLLEDIQKQTESLGAVDFILFSGDITNSGAKEEFDEVKTQLIDPVRNQLGAGVPIYCVPGESRHSTCQHREYHCSLEKSDCKSHVN